MGQMKYNLFSEGECHYGRSIYPLTGGCSLATQQPVMSAIVVVAFAYVHGVKYV